MLSSHCIFHFKTLYKNIMIEELSSSKHMPLSILSVWSTDLASLWTRTQEVINNTMTWKSSWIVDEYFRPRHAIENAALPRKSSFHAIGQLLDWLNKIYAIQAWVVNIFHKWDSAQTLLIDLGFLKPFSLFLNISFHSFYREIAPISV